MTPPYRATPLARDVFRRVGDLTAVPTYGSPAWDDLDDGDLRRVAAVLRAAEAWRRHCHPDTVAAELRDLLEAENEAARQRLSRAAADVRPWWVRESTAAERVAALDAYAREQAWAHWAAWHARQAKGGAA